MFVIIKKGIKGFAGLFGYDVVRRAPHHRDLTLQQYKREKWLIDLQIATILDIGANEGQFAEKIRKLFPGATIYSFEPLPGVYQVLKQKFEGDAHFHAFNFALGQQEGVEAIYLNEFSPSSSMLKMQDEHKKHFGFAQNAIPVTIQIKKLDRVSEQLNLKKPILIKIDVQGFEEQVINGGMNTIESADLVIMEVSFRELYEKQLLFDGLYEKMRTLGFQYAGNYEQLVSPEDGSVLQADAIFIKKQDRQNSVI